MAWALLLCAVCLTDALLECRNGGSERQVHSGISVCVCPDKFTGSFCELAKCQNGGTSNVDLNSPADYGSGGLCHCSPFWAGELCTEFNCLNGGSRRTLSDGRADCKCRRDWQGEHCQAPSHCEHGRKTPEFGLCECDAHYKGVFCETLHCGNGDAAGEGCACRPGWQGAWCDEAAPKPPVVGALGTVACLVVFVVLLCCCVGCCYCYREQRLRQHLTRGGTVLSAQPLQPTSTLRPQLDAPSPSPDLVDK